jgi:hypothetical protein
MFLSAYERLAPLSIELWTALRDRDISQVCFVAGRIALLTGEITILHISGQLFEEMVSIFIILLGMLADCACHVAASFGRIFRICRGGRGRAG